MAEELRAGIKGEAADRVTDQNTAVAYGNTVVNVYASPAMIGLMEKAALESVLPYLAEGMTTVGTRFDVKHLAATPVGMNVVARSTLVEVDGKRLLFEVEAYDDAEIIGKGVHERFIVKLEGFLKRTQAKTAKS
ncbi:MAG TPA: thioesterase family protein [Bacillota bacterium]|nr:thioesterase family protein [Bacillota bacterium]